MKVYLTIVEDRHCDPEITVFKYKRDAVRLAKDSVQTYRNDGYEPEEEEIGEWLYYCRVSDEGDSVRVEEKEVT